MTLAAKSPAVIYHKELKETGAAEETVPVLVSQNCFRLSEPYRYKRIAWRMLDDADCLTVAYSMLLQDRVEESLRFLGRVDPKKVETATQADYFRA